MTPLTNGMRCLHFLKPNPGVLPECGENPEETARWVNQRFALDNAPSP